MRTIATAIAIAALAAPAAGEVVTERWGHSGRCRHAGSASFQTTSPGRVVMKFDLSKLPKGAKVYRARLLMPIQAGPGPLKEPILIRSLLSAVSTSGGWAVDPQPLKLLAPRYRSFDATEAVRGWASGKRANHGLGVDNAPGWDRLKTHLEITYEGRLTDPPPAATGLKAFHRAGQVFLTWQEVRCPFAGKAEVPWDEMQAHRKALAEGKAEQVSYRIYRHAEPITSGNLHRAELLDEVAQLSAFDERMIQTEWKGERIKNVRVGSARVPRVCVQPQAELPVGTGVYVRTSDRAGEFHYAVVAACDGVENTRDLNEGNSLARPVSESVARPEPILHHQKDSHVYDRGRPHRFYLLWTDPPLSNVPNYYHMGTTSPAKLPAMPLPLYVHSFWWDNGWAGSGAREAIKGCVSLQMETPWVLHKGVHEGTGTYKAFAQGKVQDYWVRRLRNVLPWLKQRYNVDPRRTYAMSSDWAWHHGDLFAAVHENLTTDPKRSPTAIEGWRYWGRVDDPAKTEWGISAWKRYDIAWYVRQHPKLELPMIYYTPNMHEGDFGDIDKPRFYRAMLDTKRAFIASWGARIDARWIYELKRSDTLAAFANCSLDDSPGIGMGGDPNGQINGYLRFDPATAVDEPDRWEMTVWLHAGDDRGRGAAPADACTVDVTPRRCREFRPRRGQRFQWTAAPLPGGEGAGAGRVQKGTALADEHGLVTAEKVIVTKGRRRIAIRR